jgi:hypothetical protein
MGSYESRLRGAGLPSGEISIIVHNLEKLEGAGFRGDINKIVDRIIKDTSFRTAFQRDYRAAMK